MLLLNNPWWKTGSISKEKAKEYLRFCFKEIRDLIKYRQIVILTGLRRVGKTTLMYQTIRELLKKTKPKKILYFSFDEKLVEPITILKEYEKLTDVNWKKERIYVFFDEIQRLKDWSLKIKQIYDSLPNIKIFLSGSASLAIESDVIRNLAGRYFLREIPPLTLKEFFELYFKRELDNFELYRDDLEKIFPYYIKKPFPEIVEWKNEKRVYEYIRELVIDKVVKIDIPEIFNKVRIHLLSTLVNEFFSNPGEILNIDSLSKSLRIHKTIIEQHIDYLGFAKMIKLVKNYRPSIRATSRKLKKVYPYNVSLCFPFYPDLTKGEIYESLIASLDIETYWRKGNKEVDFIKFKDKKIIPIEVKAKEDLKKEDTQNLVYFLKRYNIKEGIVVYLGENRIKKIDNYKIKFVNIIDALLSPMFLRWA